MTQSPLLEAARTEDQDAGEARTRLLGQMLVARGLVQPEEIDKALQLQSRIGGKIGAILLRTGALSEDALLRTLAEQLDMHLLSSPELPVEAGEVQALIEQSGIPREWWIDQAVMAWSAPDGMVNCVARWRRSPRQQVPELLITGIPRSGTSHLCALLHRVADVVVINEPGEIFDPLREQPVPWGVAVLHRELRARILDGLPVRNKLSGGRLIEDTAEIDRMDEYSPRVTRPDFILGSKNTLAYLARIQRLRQAMPGVRMVACVRHPLDTLASWKRSFDHLREADVRALPLGGPGDPLLPEDERERLRGIEHAASPALARALFWSHLAQQVWQNRQDLVLVHYEELVTHPGQVVRRILEPLLDDPRRIPVLSPSTRRSHRDLLDEADLEAARALCAPLAGNLGYTPF